MKRAVLYSRSTSKPANQPHPGALLRRNLDTGKAPAQAPNNPTENTVGAVPAAGVAAALSRRQRLQRLTRRFEQPLLVLIGMLIMAALFLTYQSTQPPVRKITQDDIDKAVLNTLETQTLPSPAARAYEAIREQVVRVRGFPGEAPPIADPNAKDKPVPEDDLPSAPRGDRVEKGADKFRDKAYAKGPGEDREQTGTGVVIVDTGIILTNLHVVAGAKTIRVVFHDGLESEARLIKAQPEQDLAVLQARTLPDDLQAATLKSSAELAIGDRVVAVGFPFGIGPSASAGVVSGLGREYRSPEGKRSLSNLIQFDAAANPGNSGGPLVNMDGEVVGIVTGILNPTEQRVFIGIGFAVPIESAAGAVGLSPF